MDSCNLRGSLAVELDRANSKNKPLLLKRVGSELHRTAFLAIRHRRPVQLRKPT